MRQPTRAAAIGNLFNGVGAMPGRSAARSAGAGGLRPEARSFTAFVKQVRVCVWLCACARECVCVCVCVCVCMCMCMCVCVSCTHEDTLVGWRVRADASRL